VAVNAVLAYLGDRLGLWRELASTGSVTSAQLAERSGLTERYLREWLAAQAAAGYLDYHPETASFTLPAERAAVLADDDSPVAMAGMFELAAAVWASVDRLASAFATGEGIAWHEHDERLTSAVERNYRPLYANSLLSQWLPAVPGLVERLRDGARVLDVGCGVGTPTLMLAEAFPAPPSSASTWTTSRCGALRRQRPAAGSGGVPTSRGRGWPSTAPSRTTSSASSMRCTTWVTRSPSSATSGHCWPRTASSSRSSRWPATGSRTTSIGRPAWYASSATVCLPGSLSQAGGAALGAQAGPARLLDVFAQAGLTAQVAIATDMNLVVVGRP
jgi:hypothetical protein